MHADLCSLLRPPPTRAEQPHNLFSCVYFPKGIIPSIDEWTTLWAHVERSLNTERRFDALMYGAVGLRHWLGSCTLPRIIPTTRKAFEGSGFMRWYAALVAGIQALPPSEEREDAAQFLEEDVLPLLMRIDPWVERKDLWCAAREELSAMRNCRV